jgi:hypothetical protein
VYVELEGNKNLVTILNGRTRETAYFEMAYGTMSPKIERPPARGLAFFP